MKLLNVIGVLVLGSILGFFGATVYSPQGAGVVKLSQSTDATPSITAHLMVDNGKKIVTARNVRLETPATVFDLLDSVADVETKTYEGLGIFINSVKRVGSSGGAWWQYWVNNEYASVAADTYSLHNNDVVLWKLTSEQEANANKTQ